jgi:hypothetical protein
MHQNKNVFSEKHFPDLKSLSDSIDGFIGWLRRRVFHKLLAESIVFGIAIEESYDLKRGKNHI